MLEVTECSKEDHRAGHNKDMTDTGNCAKNLWHPGYISPDSCLQIRQSLLKDSSVTTYVSNLTVPGTNKTRPRGILDSYIL